MGNSWKATSNSHHPEVWWLVFTASAVVFFLQIGLCNAMKVPLYILRCQWRGGVVDLFLRELPFTVMVHVGSERERPCFCGLFKYTTSHQSGRVAEKGRYSSYSSQDTCSCHYKSEPSLRGGPKGPTRPESRRLSFSSRDNVTLFSIKAALRKITVSPLNPTGRLQTDLCTRVMQHSQLNWMPFVFQGWKPTGCRHVNKISISENWIK